MLNITELWWSMINWFSARNPQPDGIPTITELFLAVRSGNVDQLTDWKKKVSLPKVKNDNTGEVLLHEAVACRNITMVTWLLDEGCSCLAADISKNTPLHCAADLGYSEIVEVLARKCPRTLTMTNLWGRTPLMKSLARRRNEVSKMLIATGDEVQLDLIDNYGQSPMIIAACNGDVAVVNLLLENGADINIKDTKGRTACYFAILHRFDRIFDILLLKTLRFNLELGVAVETGHLYATKQLISQGADVDRIYYKNSSILPLAIQKLSNHITNNCVMSFERYSIADEIVSAYGYAVDIHDLLQIQKSLNFRQYPVLNKLMFKTLLSSANIITNSRALFGDMRLLCHKRSDVIKLKYLACSASRRSIMTYDAAKVLRWEMTNSISGSHRKGTNLVYKCNQVDIPETFKNIILMRNI